MLEIKSGERARVRVEHEIVRKRMEKRLERSLARRQAEERKPGI